MGSLAACVAAACAESSSPPASDAGIETDAGDAAVEQDAGDAAVDPIEDAYGVLRMNHSGSRLSVITLGAPFGEARAPLRIVDEELRVTCSVGLASDGSLRCIPVADEAQLLGYTDADCTEPIYETLSARACYGETRWAREFVVGSARCKDGGVERVFPLEAVDAPESILEANCERTTAVEPDVFVFARGPELELDAMVELVRTEIATEGGLVMEMLEAEDGTRIAASLIDPTYGPCVPNDLAELGLRCVQTTTAFGPSPGIINYWSDPNCRQVPLAVSHFGAPDCPHPPAMVYSFGAGEQPGLAHLDAFVTGTIYEEADGSCVARDTSELSYVYATIGAPFEDGELPRMSTGELRSESIAIPYYATEHGVLLTAQSASDFIDLKRGAPCHAERARGGEYRCIPENAELLQDDPGFFADSVCSQRLGDTFAEEPPPLFAVYNDDPCGKVPFENTVTSLFQTGPRFTGTVYTLIYTGGTPDHDCQPAAETRAFYRLGDDVLDDMPLLVERKE